MENPTDSWLDRRQRAVRCKRHGLHFDPALTSGCALCRKEGLLDLPAKKPQLVLLLLALLGIALITLRLSGPLADTLANLGAERQAAATAPRIPPAAGDTVRPLPPAGYAGELTAVENALYRPVSGEPSAVAESVERALAALAASLTAVATPDSRTAATAVAELAAGVDPTTFVVDDLPPLRQRWRHLRSTYFLAAGGPPAFGEEEQVYEPAAVAAYRDAARRLVALLEDGRTLVTPLLRPRRPWAAEEDHAARREQWQPLRRDWQERLQTFAADLPSRPPATAGAPVLTAVTLFENALREARALAADRDLAVSADAEARFEAALATARQAVLAFEDPALLAAP